MCRVAAPAPGPPPPGRSQPQSTSLQVGVRIPSHIGSIGSAFTHNKHVIITDTTTDPRTSSATGLVASGAAPRTFACFPIRSSKSSAAALGVVQVFARHPSFFASHTVQHMQAAAGLLAAALAAAARVQRSVEHVSQGVPVAAGRVETCIMLSSTVCNLLKCERCVFYLYDPSSGCLVHWKSDAAQIVFPLERGLAGVCARSCVAFKVDYAYLDPNYDAEIDCQHDTSVRSILTCPLTNRVNALVGVVHAQNKMRGFFTRENMELLQSMASQLGETLCNNVQYHSMRHSVDVHVRVAQATQDLLRCDDMKSVLETGEMVGAEEHVTRHTSHVTRHTSHVTRHTSLTPGAYVARTFVGARSSRAFLLDKENNALLYPTPALNEQGITGFISEQLSAISRANSITADPERCQDTDGNKNTKPSSPPLFPQPSLPPSPPSLPPPQACHPPPSNPSTTSPHTSSPPLPPATWLTPQPTRGLVARGFWREFRARGQRRVCQWLTLEQGRCWGA